MDSMEKFEFLMILTIISMTIFLFVFLNVWINKKVKNNKAYRDY